MTDEDRGTSGADDAAGEDQQPSRQRRVDPADDSGSPFTGEDHDVALEVPKLNVEEISLEVEELRAHISARAELVDFLNIGVGVDIYLDGVKLQVKGVEAQLQLKVKLERMLGTIDRALAVMADDPRRRNFGAEPNRPDDGGDDAPDAGVPQSIEGGDDLVEKGPDEGEKNGVGRETGVQGDANATDAARARARALGVDLSGLRGTGSGGRILVRDVERAAR